MTSCAKIESPRIKDRRFVESDSAARVSTRDQVTQKTRPDVSSRQVTRDANIASQRIKVGLPPIFDANKQKTRQFGSGAPILRACADREPTITIVRRQRGESSMLSAKQEIQRRGVWMVDE
jgi:hypothetical protein